MMIRNQLSGHAKKLDEEDKIVLVLEMAPKDKIAPNFGFCCFLAITDKLGEQQNLFWQSVDFGPEDFNLNVPSTWQDEVWTDLGCITNRGLCLTSSFLIVTWPAAISRGAPGVSAGSSCETVTATATGDCIAATCSTRVIRAIISRMSAATLLLPALFFI